MTTIYVEKFWRDATAADVAQVMAGKEVEARFADMESAWSNLTKLRGFDTSDGNLYWISSSGSCWRHCQVYSPPQWFLDKPEPGEEFRLLEKFPDEALQVGDEAFDLRGDGKWESSLNSTTGRQHQSEGVWYRRRIEQPKPEPKHYVLRVGDTISTPSGRQAIVTELGIEVS